MTPNPAASKGNGNSEVPREDYLPGTVLCCYDLTFNEAFLGKVVSADHDSNWIRYQMDALKVLSLEGDRPKVRDPTEQERRSFRNLAVSRKGYSYETRETCDWRVGRKLDLGLLKKCLKQD